MQDALGKDNADVQKVLQGKTPADAAFAKSGLADMNSGRGPQGQGAVPSGPPGVPGRSDKVGSPPAGGPAPPPR